MALLAAACGGSDPAPSADSPTPAPAASPSDGSAGSLSDDVVQTITDFVGDRDGGVSALVRRNGEEVAVAVGVADAQGTPLVPQDTFRVGSVSKPFVATIILQLVDEGALALDDPLGLHLPDIVWSEATIAELLGHRSGIPNYTEQPAFFADALGSRDTALEVGDILGYVEGVAPGPAGTFAYSNTNYVLLGALIEYLDGADLATSLAARITEPLGLADTYFETAARPSSGVAGLSADVLDGDRDAVYTSIATGAWAAGALVSSTDDLATFLEALLTGGLVSDEALKAMTDTAGTGYGLGLFQVSFGPGSDAFGHSGGIPGYTSTMAMDPGTGETLVILTNNDQLLADLLAQRLLD